MATEPDGWIFRTRAGWDLFRVALAIAVLHFLVKVGPLDSRASQFLTFLWDFLFVLLAMASIVLFIELPSRLWRRFRTEPVPPEEIRVIRDDEM